MVGQLFGCCDVPSIEIGMKMKHWCVWNILQYVIYIYIYIIYYMFYVLPQTYRRLPFKTVNSTYILGIDFTNSDNTPQTTADSRDKAATCIQSRFEVMPIDPSKKRQPYRSISCSLLSWGKWLFADRTTTCQKWITRIKKSIGKIPGTASRSLWLILEGHWIDPDFNAGLLALKAYSRAFQCWRRFAKSFSGPVAQHAPTHPSVFVQFWRAALDGVTILTARQSFDCAAHQQCMRPAITLGEMAPTSFKHVFAPCPQRLRHACSGTRAVSWATGRMG